MQSPTPANSDNVQRQLAIFEVVRRAPGKTLAEVKAMLTKAFADRGLSRQPGPWLDAVASDAARGKPYIVDLPAAVAADSITPAPNSDVEVDLRERRALRAESSADGQHPSAEGQEAGRGFGTGEAGREGDGDHGPGLFGVPPRRLLGFLAAAAAIALAAAGVRTALRRRGGARPRVMLSSDAAGRRHAHKHGHAHAHAHGQAHAHGHADAHARAHGQAHAHGHAHGLRHA